MERININTRYISNHHNILGPARFLPYESRGWRAPIFDYGRPLGGYRPPFGGYYGYGGGMYEQNVIIDNRRTGFLGGVADFLEGLTRGYFNMSWLINGMQQYMPQYTPAYTQQYKPQTMQEDVDTNNNQRAQHNTHLENLKAYGEKNGYNIQQEGENEYTAWGGEKGHITGDYDTVKNFILDNDDDGGE